MLIRKKLSKSEFALIPNQNKGRNGVDAVTVSTVDRFQGDEADIVLASLVIDAKSTSPFVKLRNRMIVLLSRARIASYLIGNVGYFESKPAAHWELTMKLLNNPSQNGLSTSYSYTGPRIGSSFPICCPLHRNQSKMMVSDASDFNFNFCKEKCVKKLICSHSCNNICHWPKIDSHNSKCIVEIDSPCKDHPKKIPCFRITNGSMHIDQALQNFKCGEIVEIQQICGHTKKVTCEIEVNVAKGIAVLEKCTEKAHEPYIYPLCKHPLECNCSELASYIDNPTSVKPCGELVDYIPPCGHNIQLKCSMASQKNKNFVCKAKFQANLPRCGHATMISCSNYRNLETWTGISVEIPDIVMEGVDYGEKDFHCTKNVKFQRKCGHHLDVPCFNAFLLAKNPGKCAEKDIIVSPVCGHNCEVACHVNQQLGKTTRGLQKVTVVRESLQFNDYFIKPAVSIPACSKEVVFFRACGHQEKISCNQAMSIMNGSQKLKCTTYVQLANPQCGHQIEVPCSMSYLWKAWSDEFVGSEAWLKLVNDHVLNDNIESPLIIPDEFNSILGMCSQTVILRRAGCEHEENMQCNDAFKQLSKKSRCRIKVLKPLFSCEHTKTFKCSEYSDYKKGLITHDCNEITNRKCWNYEICGNRVNDICSKVKVSCAASTVWRCDKDDNHSLLLKQCSQGAPDKCPECDLLDLDKYIETHESLLDSSGLNQKLDIIFGTNLLFCRDKIAGNLSNLPLSQTALRSFIDRKLAVLRNFSSWVQMQEFKNKLKFSPQLVPCFVNLEKRNIHCTDFDPKVFMKAKEGGLKVQSWTKSRLKIISDSMKEGDFVKLLLGYGFTCLPLMNENTPKKNRKNNRIGVFECLQTADELTFRDPFCVMAIGRVEFSKSDLSKYVDELDAACHSLTSPSKFITFEAAPLSKNLKSQTKLIQSLTSILSDTVAAGILITSTWDGRSLGIVLDDTLAKTLQKNLSFTKINQKSPSPFAGVNKLKNMMKSCPAVELILFEALEFFNNNLYADGIKSLSLYADSLRKSGDFAHPLLLIALSRKLHYEKRSQAAIKLIDLFLKMFPTATVWLKPSELNDKKLEIKIERVNSALSAWHNIKENEDIESEAMEKLMKMTGLRKVKESSVAMFRSAIAFQKLSEKDRKANSMSLNKIFLGNPGSGKTTVARLFAEIMYDSGIRKKNTFIETSAQELKDGGVDEFRKLIKKAMDGVLFIDEACKSYFNCR